MDIHVEHARDVLAAQPKARAGLDREAADRFLVCRELGAQKLQRHQIVEADVPCGHNVPDTAAAKDAQQLILAMDDLAGLKRHLLEVRDARILLRHLPDCCTTTTWLWIFDLAGHRYSDPSSNTWVICFGP